MAVVIPPLTTVWVALFVFLLVDSLEVKTANFALAKI